MGSMPVPVEDHESEEEEEEEDEYSDSEDEYENLIFVPPIWPPQPYMYEPRRKPGEKADHADSEAGETESDDDDTDDEGESLTGLGAGRSGASVLSDWCTCSACDTRWLLRDSEHTCCHELPGEFADKYGLTGQGGGGCITSNSDFPILCLNKVVLRNVMAALNDLLFDNWNVDNPTNKSYRIVAYRQFLWWVSGHLKKHVRHNIPACVTDAIRKTFPKQDDEQYETYPKVQ